MLRRKGVAKLGAISNEDCSYVRMPQQANDCQVAKLVDMTWIVRGVRMVGTAGVMEGKNVMK